MKDKIPNSARCEHVLPWNVHKSNISHAFQPKVQMHMYFQRLVIDVHESGFTHRYCQCSTQSCVPHSLPLWQQPITRYASRLQGLKSVMEALKEIPPPAFVSIVWKEKQEPYSTAMRAVLHHCFCVSSWLWVVCSTAVIYQSAGGILFVTFIFPTSKLNANKYMLGPFKVMGSTEV